MMSIRQYLDTILYEQGYDAWEQEDEYMLALVEQDIDQEIETGVEGNVFEEYCVSVGVDLSVEHATLGDKEVHY